MLEIYQTRVATLTNIVSEQSKTINTSWSEVETISKDGTTIKDNGDEIPLSQEEKERLESFRRFL